MKKIKNELMNLNLSDIIALVSAVISIAALVISIAALAKNSKPKKKRVKSAEYSDDFDMFDYGDEDQYDFTLSEIGDFENDLLVDDDGLTF